jgi:hypothetical protein
MNASLAVSDEPRAPDLANAMDVPALLAALDAWGDEWTIQVDLLLESLVAGIGMDLPDFGEGTMGTMSVSEYARYRKARGLRGGTRPAVQTALKNGRIHKLADGTIDPAVADMEWSGSTDPRKNGGRPDAASGDGQPAGGSLNQARLVNEVLRAKHSRLRLEAAEGRVVDADAVARRWFAAGQRVRDLLLAMKAQVAPEVVAAVRNEPDDGRAVAAVDMLLDLHLRRALSSLDQQPSTEDAQA